MSRAAGYTADGRRAGRSLCQRWPRARHTAAGAPHSALHRPPASVALLCRSPPPPQCSPAASAPRRPGGTHGCVCVSACVGVGAARLCMDKQASICSMVRASITLARPDPAGLICTALVFKKSFIRKSISSSLRRRINFLSELKPGRLIRAVCERESGRKNKKKRKREKKERERRSDAGISRRRRQSAGEANS